MSIPGGNVKNRKPPIQREGVGGSIKAIAASRMNFFAPCLVVKAIDGDEDMFFRSPVMWGAAWTLSGVTKDSAGSVLGGCVVHLFYVSNDVLVSEKLSDPTTGAFTFNIGPNAGPFYVVAYKAGSPDVAGTTVNTLMPVVT